MQVKHVRITKPRNGITITLETLGGEVAYDLSIRTARELMRLLFIHISPDWGGTRPGAGKRKDDFI